jgi:biofilm PGA synthesis N-glycosyltransferase PgaC
MMEWLFWIAFLLLLYTYVLYPIILLCIVKLFGKKSLKPNTLLTSNYPSVALIIPAYNEADCIQEKIENSLNIIYPSQLSIFVVTDGSTDGTESIVASYNQVVLLHQPKRLGKIEAMKTALNKAKAEILVFTDANSLLNANCLQQLIPHFANSSIAAVSGEKKIILTNIEDAMLGEGIYWKYESFIKKMEARFNTVIGMPGELFAIRSGIFPELQQNTITEDFAIAMQLIENGYIIAYEPNAVAAEKPSASIMDEFKRKKRIAAGSIQTLLRTLHLCNPFKYPAIAFQYISHKVLRWLLIPLLLPILLITGIYLWQVAHFAFFKWISILQIIFYVLALIGWIAELKHVALKWLYIPFYYCFMNIAMLAGMMNYLLGRQPALWEKAIRK